MNPLAIFFALIATMLLGMVIGDFAAGERRGINENTDQRVDS